MATLTVANDSEFNTALTTAVAGDVVEIAAGTYTRDGTTDRFVPAFNFTNSGTSGNPIIAKAMGEVTLNATSEDTGTVSSATASTLTDSSKTWGTSWETGGRYAVVITANTGVGQIGFINSHTDDTLTLIENWPVTPDATSTYKIVACGPMIGSGDRDYIEWTVDDIATDKYIINAVDAPARSDTGHGIMYSCSGCKIEGAEINGTQHLYSDNYNAIRLEDAVSCTVKNNWMSGIRHSTATNHNGAAVMTYRATLCIIEHNEIDDVGCGVNIKGEGISTQHSNIVRYNKISNYQTGVRVDFSTGVSGNSECYQNILSSADSGATCLNPGSDVRNWTFYNNTIYDAASGSGVYYSNGLARTALTFRDNLFVSVTSAIDLSEIAAMTAEDSLDYDHVFVLTRFGQFNGGNKPDRATFFTDVGHEENGGDTDPDFVNAATGDFHLDTGSPALTSSSTGGPVGAYITGEEEIGVQSALVVASGGGSSSGISMAMYMRMAYRKSK